MSSRKPLRKTVSGYTRFRNVQSVVPRLRKEPDELVRKMLLIGYLTERLEKKKPESVYIVGGQAVETYTAGQFKTGDIDIVTPDSKAAGEILKRVGFEREGMIWLNKALGLAIHWGDFETGWIRERRNDMAQQSSRVGDPHCWLIHQKL